MDTIKEIISDHFLSLKYTICDAIEELEQEYISITDQAIHLKLPGVVKMNHNTKFDHTEWSRNGGGGGKMSIIHGNVFQKMGVNWSLVFGQSSQLLKGKSEHVTQFGDTFWATGISLVAHPLNPFVPPIHMNLRSMSTSDKFWFGGALDLNPIYKYEEDTNDFHNTIKDLCDKFDQSYYPMFSKECDEYFWLPHRNESRGIGGIFFEHMYFTKENFLVKFEFVKSIGNLFLPLYNKIIKRHLLKPWTIDNYEYQLLRRGRYAEFNLLYDRGIKFGLATGGNPDGMFMSMPPLVKW